MKHKPVKKSDILKVKDGKIERIRRSCPRCGDDVFMAEHKDRYYCGRCQYTEWKKVEKTD